MSQLEPIIESSFLYKKKDGKLDFTHDIYREFFLARYFANEINSGRLSLKYDYPEYNFDYPNGGTDMQFIKEDVGHNNESVIRKLLANKIPVLAFMFSFLEPDKAQELLYFIEEIEREARITLAKDLYNPLYMNLVHFYETISTYNNISFNQTKISMLRSLALP